MSAAGDPIRVLLVDDDTEWARPMADLLERRTDALEVTTAASGGAALEILAGERIDCIVSDYHMPGMDGLELLELVREDRPDMPFVMVTGRGTEAIASEAISLEVTDYFTKDPNRDQSEALATRITNAVYRRRLERSLAASRERFAALFDALPDPAAVVALPTLAIRTHNPAFAHAFGDGGDLEGRPLPELFGDADLDGGDADATGEIREVTRRTAEGRRTFLRRRFPLQSDAPEPEHCYLYTDITERKRRRRALENERDTKEAIRDILVTSSGRAEIEAAYCERLLDTGDYRLAWIGEVVPDREVVPRARAGADDGYLDAVDLGVTDGGDGEPSVVAATAEEPQVVGNIDLRSNEAWAATAREHGFRSAMSIPLVNDGLLYGVMSVYADDASAFDDRRRRLLEELGEALAYAISSEQQREALYAQTFEELTLTVRDRSAPLVALGRKVEGGLRVRSSIPRSSDAVVYFVRADSVPAAELRAAAEAVPAVERVEIIDEGASRAELLVATPTISAALASADASVRSIAIEEGVASVVARIPNRRDVRAVVDAFTETYPEATLDSFRSARAGDDGHAAGELTEKQRQALEAAYRSGYFEIPKGRSAEEVASSLGISRSTFSQHLRVAQQKLLGSYFDEGALPPPGPVDR